jgi:outer membrane receptor protein involved in Fe transport
VNARWTEFFRSNFGLRSDQYRFKVASDRVENSGNTQAQIFSPALSLVLGPWQKSEFYFNLGQGFHSNDARASVSTIDPQSLEATQRSPGLVKSHGMEFGVRSELIPNLQSSLSLYRLDFDSELSFAGDAGTTEAGRPSRRLGIEITNAYRINDQISLDADVAFAHARSRDTSPDGNYIEGAVEGVAQFALNIEKMGPWSANLRWRYFGPRPLTEDNSVRSHATSTLNGRITYKWRPDLRIELEAFNLTNRQDSAIDYYYASQLKGETQPQSDIHFHPIEPRSFRLMIVKNF